MDILLNEYSLDGQFNSVDDFREYMIDTLYPVLQHIIKFQFPFLKKQSIYDYKVVQNLTLNDMFKQFKSNDTAITLLKNCIVNLAYADPYWDDDVRTKLDCSYTYFCKSDEPNCFTEAIERKGALFSFPHNTFGKKIFLCKKDTDDISIMNIMDIETLLETMVYSNKEEISYILEHYPFPCEVRLARIDGKCYAEEALLDSGLTSEDMMEIIKALPIMMTGLKSGNKNRFWDSLKDGLFEFRIDVSSNRTFRLLFLQDGGYVVFLNGFIKKTQTTPKREIDKALKIKKYFK